MWLLFFKLWRVSIYTADNIVRTPLCNNKSISKCHHLFFDVSFSKYLGKNVSLLLFSCFSSCNLKSWSITKIHFKSLHHLSHYLFSLLLLWLCWWWHLSFILPHTSPCASHVRDYHHPLHVKLSRFNPIRTSLLHCMQIHHLPLHMLCSQK